MNEIKNIDGGYIEITPEERKRRLGMLFRGLLAVIGTMLYFHFTKRLGWDKDAQWEAYPIFVMGAVWLPMYILYHRSLRANNKMQEEPMAQMLTLSYGVAVLSAVCSFIHHTGQISPPMLYALPIVAIQIGLLGKIFLLYKNYEPTEDELPKYKRKLFVLLAADISIMLLMLYRVFFVQ